MNTLLKHLQRSLLASMAILLFANMTFSFAVDIHFCGGKYHSVAFFGNQARCGMMSSSTTGDTNSSACSQNESNHQEEACSKSCCKNSTFLQDDVYKNDLIDSDVSLEDFQLDLIVSNFEMWKDLPLVLENEKYDPPPEITGHLEPESLQVFLI